MREFSFTFDKGLTKGLRSTETNPRNNQALVDCYNLKPGVLGLEPFVPITDKSGDLSVSWPYPQIFMGTDSMFICEATKIYEVASNWTQTLKVTTTEFNVWDFVDYDTYAIFVNGAKIVIRDSLDNSYTAYDSLTTMPRVLTACDFKGQMIGGNVKSTWHGCGTNSVIWSAVGSNDFTPGEGNVKGSVNEAGFITSMNWSGQVLKVRRLGDHVIVYGDNGITALKPHEHVFGKIEIAQFGIAYNGAVGGSIHEHVFVDKQGRLWKINSKLELTELGYKEFISDIDLTEVMVSYDEGNQEYAIADDDYGFLLTKNGLCQIYQRITSMIHKAGTTYGVTDDSTDDEGRVKSDIIDLGISGIKTIMGLECGMYHPSGGGSYEGYAGVDYKYNKVSSFTSGDWKLLNPSGAVTCITGGEEFQIKVKADNYTGMRLDYIVVDVKITDRRFMRGPKANSLEAITE